MNIKIAKHGNHYKIKHYNHPHAKTLNEQSKDFVFTLIGAEKVKRSFERRYGMPTLQNKT